MVASRVSRAPSTTEAKRPTGVVRGLGRLPEPPAPVATLAGLTPPPRFGRTSFEDYEPHVPSQREAVERVARFAREAAEAARPPRFRLPWRKGPVGRGLYLDGGFGVGKTHLLAAAWHAADLAPDRKRYLSFQELVYTLGVLGRAGGGEAFAGTALVCIDEFELDDPGNTLIVSTFLQERFAQGAHVLTTSNTPPASQGEGRFAAEDFRREIQGIAARFEVQRIDGPDHRAAAARGEFASPRDLDEAEARAPRPVVRTTGTELARTLERLHPVRYRGLLEGLETLLVDDVRPIHDQNAALRFVHFVDKAYDLGLRFRASASVPLAGLFAGEYRHGAYQKKHDRCLSRLSELLQEPLVAPPG